MTQAYLSPEVAAKVRDLRLRARAVVEGFLVGAHRSPWHGYSVEFAEHRPYERGDDPRWIDWNVYARRERHFVRKFEEETNLRAYIVLDASASMAYADKFAYSKTLAAAFAYILHLQRDAVGLHVFGGKPFHLPPRAARAHVARILKALDDAEPAGGTTLESLEDLASSMRARGLVVIISDLFAQREKLVRAVGGFRYRKHETLVCSVHADAERRVTSGTLFRDMETGERVPFDARLFAHRYERDFDAWRRETAKELRARRATCEFLWTSTPFDVALRALLSRRRTL